MRIELQDARAVGLTSTTYGETPIVPAGAGTETTRGGIVLQQDDPDPERIILDDFLGTFVPAANADAHIGVAGDLNAFEYADSVTALTDDGARLLDLPDTLPDDERYTYVYEGNSQVLDHIALTPALAEARVRLRRRARQRRVQRPDERPRGSGRRPAPRAPPGDAHRRGQRLGWSADEPGCTCFG